MQVQTWAWLIGMSDAGDQRLLEWAKSFSTPPSLKLQGRRLDSEPYWPERRAIRLVVEARNGLTIGLTPATPCVNPVFELSRAREGAGASRVGRAPLAAKDYAWDGKTLWLNATLARPAQLRLVFDGSPDSSP